MLDDVLAIPIATLNELAQQADEQEHVYKNPALAAGMRLVITEMVQGLAALGESLIDRPTAEKISGLGERQLRRIAHNYGTRRFPLYKLREVGVKASGQRAAPDQEPLQPQVRVPNASATRSMELQDSGESGPAPATTAIDSPSAHHSAPARAPFSTRRSSARDLQVKELARQAAQRHRVPVKASA